METCCQLADVQQDSPGDCGCNSGTRLEISEYKIYRKCCVGGQIILKPLYLTSEKVDRLKQSPVYYFTGDLGLAYCLQRLDLLRLQAHGYMYHWLFGKSLVLQHACIPAYKFALGTHYTQMQKSVGEIDYLKKRNMVVSRRIHCVRKKMESGPNSVHTQDPGYKLDKGIKLPYGTGVECCSDKQLLILIPSMVDCILIDQQDCDTLIKDSEMFEKTRHYGLSYLIKLLKLHTRPNKTNLIPKFKLTWIKDDECLRKKVIRVIDRQDCGEYMLTALSGEFYQVNLTTKPVDNQHVRDISEPARVYTLENKLEPILQDCSPANDPSTGCVTCPDSSGNPLRAAHSITWCEQLVDTKRECPKFLEPKNKTLHRDTMLQTVQRGGDVMKIDCAAFSAHLECTNAKKTKELLALLRKQVHDQDLAEDRLLDRSGILASIGSWVAGSLGSETQYTKACREFADLKAAQYGDLKRWLTNCRKELTEILAVQITRWEDDENLEQVVQLREISRGTPDPALARKDMEALHYLIKLENIEMAKKKKHAAASKISQRAIEFASSRSKAHLIRLRNTRVDQIQTHNRGIDELYIETYV